MPIRDRVIQLVISVFLIVGVYQFYFWCQRNQWTRPRELKLPIDDRIPFRPRWVWVYSFLYYPVILYMNVVMVSPRARDQPALLLSVGAGRARRPRAFLDGP